MSTVSICTLGCRVNQYESRALAEIFVKNGYTVVPFGEKCDVCIINTCAVTEESERKSAQMIRRGLKLCGDVRVCGCFAERCGEFPGVTRLTGCASKGSLQDFCKTETTAKGYELLKIGTVAPSELCGISQTRAFVKIQDGCNGKCTYCIIPKLRGGIRSRPPKEILSEIRSLVAMGYKEIILTGIETAAYNFMPLWELIKEVAATEGLERLRLGSLDPNVINTSFIEAVADSKNIMPHFHISLQSGCSRILKLMKRPYTAEEAKQRIIALKKAMPQVKLSADIICSFPTETEEELWETIDYLKSIGFLHIHGFSYSKRPGTEAALMDGQIPENEKRRRMSMFLTECTAMTQSVLCKKLNETVNVLIEKAGAEASGHTEDFCEAVIKTSRPVAEGDTVVCRVTEVRDGKLKCIQI